MCFCRGELILDPGVLADEGDKVRDRGLRNIGDSARAVLNQVFESRAKMNGKDHPKACVGGGQGEIDGEIAGHDARRLR